MFWQRRKDTKLSPQSPLQDGVSNFSNATTKLQQEVVRPLRFKTWPPLRAAIGNLLDTMHDTSSQRYDGDRSRYIDARNDFVEAVRNLRRQVNATFGGRKVRPRRRAGGASAWDDDDNAVFDDLRNARREIQSAFEMLYGQPRDLCIELESHVDKLTDDPPDWRADPDAVSVDDALEAALATASSVHESAAELWEASGTDDRDNYEAAAENYREVMLEFKKAVEVLGSALDLDPAQGGGKGGRRRGGAAALPDLQRWYGEERASLWNESDLVTLSSIMWVGHELKVHIVDAWNAGDYGDDAEALYRSLNKRIEQLHNAPEWTDEPEDGHDDNEEEEQHGAGRRSKRAPVGKACVTRKAIATTATAPARSSKAGTGKAKGADLACSSKAGTGKAIAKGGTKGVTRKTDLARSSKAGSGKAGATKSAAAGAAASSAPRKKEHARKA